MKRVIIRNADLIKLKDLSRQEVYVKSRMMENGLNPSYPFETTISSNGDYVITQGELEVIENYLAE